MKRSILIIAFMFVCFGIKSIAANPDDCYLKSGDKVYVGKDIKEGLIHTRIILQDGTTVEVDNHDISAYRHHNKVYMLMPVICNYRDTLCFAMMEYISSKNGFSIFRYCCRTDQDELTNAQVSHFFIYKNGKFYRRIDEDQTEALAAFGIKMI